MTRPPTPAPAVMVCGTSSGAGKSFVVTGLCRLLARRGVAVAPFKAQNMSNNAAVTPDGAEIGRAQYAQALAAGAVPEAAMNPVLLKPSSDRGSHLVVMGRPAGVTDARAYGGRAPDLLPVVLGALDDLRRRFGAVVMEGAGSPAEINLADRDIVNLRLAVAAGGVPSILVADIDRGGMFASVVGTLALLPDDQRALVRGVVVNKFRGDLDVLEPGLDELERRTGIPVLGVLPFEPQAPLDEEDSLALEAPGAWHAAPGAPDGPAAAGPVLDVAVIRLPRIANFTDLEPLLVEPGVGLRFVYSPAALGRPDLVVVPGTRATVADLAWLRDSGLAAAIEGSDAAVLGICGGYQMMGRRIVDPVESRAGAVDGLGWLEVETVFEPEKVVAWHRGWALGEPVTGYSIRHGRPRRLDGGDTSWVSLEGDPDGETAEGCVSPGGRFRGTSLHGLFEHDGFRRRFLAEAAARRGVRFRPGQPGSIAFAAHRARRHDQIADLLERHLGAGAIAGLFGASLLEAGT